MSYLQAKQQIWGVVFRRFVSFTTNNVSAKTDQATKYSQKLSNIKKLSLFFPGSGAYSVFVIQDDKKQSLLHLLKKNKAAWTPKENPKAADMFVFINAVWLAYSWYGL